MIRILILLILINNNSFAQTSFDTRRICEGEKGVWREFGNDCANNCYLDRGYKKMCVSAITFSCDCLKDRCWDYYQCVDKEKYQIEAQAFEKERIEKVKASNPELFMENRKVYTRQVDPNNPNNTNSNSTANTHNDPQNDEILDGDPAIDSKPGETLSEADQIASCSNGGGIWKKFSNGCADTCSSKSGPAICATIITQSCDCGDNRCWNGSFCILTSSY